MGTAVTRRGSSQREPVEGPPPRRGPRPAPRSFPQDLDQDASLTRSVELQKEDALPPAELQRSIDDRDGLRCGRQKALRAMGVPVRYIVVVVLEVLGAEREVVVQITCVLWDEPAHQRLEVADEARLLLVDDDGAGGMGGVDEEHPVRDPAPSDGGADVVADGAGLHAPRR